MTSFVGFANCIISSVSLSVVDIPLAIWTRLFAKNIFSLTEALGQVPVHTTIAHTMIHVQSMRILSEESWWSVIMTVINFRLEVAEIYLVDLCRSLRQQYVVDRISKRP